MQTKQIKGGCPLTINYIDNLDNISQINFKMRFIIRKKIVGNKIAYQSNFL